MTKSSWNILLSIFFCVLLKEENNAGLGMTWVWVTDDETLMLGWRTTFIHQPWGEVPNCYFKPSLSLQFIRKMMIRVIRFSHQRRDSSQMGWKLKFVGLCSGKCLPIHSWWLLYYLNAHEYNGAVPKQIGLALTHFCQWSAFAFSFVWKAKKCICKAGIYNRPPVLSSNQSPVSNDMIHVWVIWSGNQYGTCSLVAVQWQHCVV